MGEEKGPGTAVVKEEGTLLFEIEEWGRKRGQEQQW